MHIEKFILNKWTWEVSSFQTNAKIIKKYKFLDNYKLNETKHQANRDVFPTEKSIYSLHWHARSFPYFFLYLQNRKHNDLPEAGLHTPQNILPQNLLVMYSQRAQCCNGRSDRWKIGPKHKGETQKLRVQDVIELGVNNEGTISHVRNMSRIVLFF